MKSGDEILWCYHLNKLPLQQYFHMVLFIWHVVLTFESVNEILWCYHSNETSSAVLPHGTIYLVCSSGNFKSLDDSYGVTILMELLWQNCPYFLCSSFYKKKFRNFVKCFITLATFGSERFQKEL